MEQLSLEQIRAVADALTQPAFAAKDGAVCYANSAFSVLQIAVGTSLSVFFGAEQPTPVTERSEFSCTVAGIPCQATVIPMQDCVLYILQMQEQNVSIHALSHSVKSIRTSLHGMYSALAGLSDFVESAESEPYQASFNGILQGIYRLERTAQNLDMLQKLSSDSISVEPEKTEIVGYLSELCARAEELLRYADVRLEYELPDKQFNGNLDHTLAEAAFWNALSNAAANTNSGNVRIQAAHRGNLLQLTFLNGGMLLAQPDLFSRYQLAVDGIPANSGTGFGLSVIRKAVALHGGTILFAEKPGEEVAFTVTFDLSCPVPPEVHSRLPVQAGLSKGLVYLSDILPREAYDSRDIL